MESPFVLDWPFLAVLAAANGTPMLLAAAMKSRAATPIDFGLRLPDGRPLFGSHKTWRGLAGGTLAAALIGALTPLGLIGGAACGMLSLYGDLATSFVKRRFAVRAGGRVPVLDQFAETVLPLLAVTRFDAANFTPAVISCAAFIALGSVMGAAGLYVGSRNR